jgi:hypothetical protein
MNLLVNIAARFPDKGQFHHVNFDVASASLAQGCHRVGCGHLSKILCCVHVAIVLSATAFAGPPAFAETHRSSDHAADVAGFRGGEPAISLDNDAPGERRLVGKLPADFAHRCVHHGLGEVTVRCHPLDIQIFDANPSKVPDQPSSEVVRHILADVGDPLVKPGDLCPGLAPVGSTLRATGQLFVQPPHLQFVPAQGPGCLDPLPGGEDGKVSKPKVHPYHCLGFAAMRIGPLGLVNLGLDRKVPVSRSLRESGRQELAGKAEFLPSANPAELGDLDALAVESDGASFDGEAIPASALLLELRVADLGVSGLHPTEEVGEGSAEILQSIVGNGPGKLLEPSKFAVLENVDLGVERSPAWLLASRILLLPAGKAPVVREPCRSGAPLEERRLNVVRIEADALAENHFCQDSMRATIACLTTAATEVSCRRASSLSHASMVGENSISCRTSFTRFFGGAMKTKVANGMYYVKVQLQPLSVNSNEFGEIIGEHEVRRET